MVSAAPERIDVDVLVIGGGPAGLAAAARCAKLGLSTMIVEVGDRLGGIPLQCVHPGFGIHYFGEDLTGTEFIERLIDRVEELGVPYLTRAYVTELIYLDVDRKLARVLAPGRAIEIEAKAIIYAAGARERHVYEINIVGDRPSGIYTAGEAQAMMDLYGLMPGRKVLIVGSGDVGLIMARRFALEGAEVVGVVEIMPWPGGLTRNVVQCLQDFGIPLMLSHAVVAVKGRERVEAAIVAEVDENLKPVPGTEREIPCDTIVIAAGLVPNTELLERLGVAMDPATAGPRVNELLETSVPGVFAAGNALAINDLVDNVAEQGELAAEGARIFIENSGIPTARWIPLARGRGIRLVVPQLVSGERRVKLLARVSKPFRRACVEIRELGIRTCRPRLMPAEMVSIEISPGSIPRDVEKLTLEVVEHG